MTPTAWCSNLPRRSEMINALSIDVEDYFQVSAFERNICQADWGRYPLRVVANTCRILDILEEHDVKATFFVLGWIAEREPLLVRRIHSRGHEVASHGYAHQRVSSQTRREFREDICKSKHLLEDLTGESVKGYRAPSYSISLQTLWAFDELLEAGYAYDSSVFPVRHDLYGIPHWPRHPFTVVRDDNGYWAPETASARGGENAEALKFPEVPITTLCIFGKNLPVAGGGYFRLFPYTLTRWGLNRINRSERRPFVFYLHPWELDPAQPRITNISAKSRFRHYLNLHRTNRRFCRLLQDFAFGRVDHVMLEQYGNSGVTKLSGQCLCPS